MAGQNGGICLVTAWHKAVGATKFEQRKARILAVWPQPWSALTYETASVSVTLGEQLPVIKLVPPAGEGLLKPSFFKASCSSTPALNNAFDDLLGFGLVEGYSVFEVAADGSISITPDPGLSAVFDTMASTGSSRKTISLSCSVWGAFPDPSLQPIKASLSIEVLDNICWVAKSVADLYEPASATSEAACRADCRRDAGCAAYRWVGECRRYYNTATPGTTVTAIAKVTDCTAESACMELTSPTWYMAGIYCPVAPDIFHKSILYRKDGLTPEETIHMTKYLAAVDMAASGGTIVDAICGDGDWSLDCKAFPDHRVISVLTQGIQRAAKINSAPAGSEQHVQQPTDKLMQTPGRWTCEAVFCCASGAYAFCTGKKALLFLLLFFSSLLR
ncbi:unnamed protein product [Symbiodinium natans]|uniref:Apple domain-containing protein n=1 Tax=Symbiodinium natans TaxID=878477 RepID=A0A812SHR8_9DINO|nr:unnamed protein product [Symbiodinium natans]